MIFEGGEVKYKVLFKKMKSLWPGMKMKCAEAFLFLIQARSQYDLTQPFVESKRKFDISLEKNGWPTVYT